MIGIHFVERHLAGAVGGAYATLIIQTLLMTEKSGKAARSAFVLEIALNSNSR